MRRRWAVRAHLVNDALGRPVPPDTPAGSTIAGSYVTRWGARLAARRQARYESTARTGMNAVLAGLGYAPMRHRFTVERLP